QHAALTAAYGLAGFGYIITATFLPVIARQNLPGSVWVDLFWPAFGLSVALGALLTSRLSQTIDKRSLLACCYLIQCAGVLAPLVSPNVAGFMLGSALVGLPFTAITLFAMQEVRRLSPNGVTSFTGLMTASYGSGQVAGPALVAVILGSAATPAAGFRTALYVAALSLILGAVLYLGIRRLYPLPGTSRAQAPDAC
ncbi:MAG: YbfB/YjiJ family MFS transporter, partial [Burkholderiaceae bacterium]